ncbi:MAG: adenylate/guanylate cyclase domain-containing protein, partial [Acidimicrobiales bacterium]
MTTCPVCGAPVIEATRFCASCGHSLRPVADERRVVTVLFADLVGFTTLAESRDPEEVKNLVDRCFERLATVIAAYGGRVDKIIGDAIVALFGAPVAHEDDAERAVRAGLAMQQDLADWAAQASATQLRMRVGVNTGEVLVGAMRAGGDYTAMGDTVNTASRLQTMAAPGQVVVGPATFRATQHCVRYSPLGPIHAKGRLEPVPAWVAEEAIGAPGSRSGRRKAPLVGRDQELELLRRTVDAAVSRRRAQLVLVVAEAGMGKTRLAEEIACEAAKTHGAVVLEGRCVPYGEANVWWPVAEAVRYGCAIPADAPADQAIALARDAVRAAVGPTGGEAEVERVTTGLAHLLGYETDLQHIDPSRARDEVVHSLLTFVDASADQRPVIVVLSDLHWADDVVLELGDVLLERVAHKPFVLVATGRPSLFDWWQPSPGHHNLIVLNLDPLHREAAANLLGTLLDESELPLDLRETLLDRSGGNPFFLEELVSLVTESGHAGELPHTLRGLVAARLDALPVPERQMLEDAALLGRRGTVEGLHLMAEYAHDASGPDIDRTLASLVATDVLVLDGDRWAFKSELVREVTYGTLTKADRARRHAAVAKWIAANEGDRPASIEPIAHHYLTAATLARDLGGVEGLDPEELVTGAIEWLERALARAEGNELHPVVIRLCTQALQILDDQDGRRLRYLLARAKASTQLRELKSARADVDEAMREVERTADDGGRAQVLLSLGDLQQKDGDISASSVTLQRAAAAFRSLGDDDGEAESLRTFGMTRMLAEDFPAAEASFTEALELYRSAQDGRGEAWALQNLAWLGFITGRVKEADHWLRLSADTFRQIGDRGGLGWVNGLSAFVQFHLGRYAEAEELGERVLAEARERSDVWAVGMMLVLVASLRLWSGRAASAIEPATEAHELFGSIHDWQVFTQSAGVLGRALVATGRIDDGFGVLREALATARTAPGLAARRAAAIHVMAAAAQVGEPDRAPTLPDETPDEAFGFQDRNIAAWLLSAQSGDPEPAVAGVVRIADRTP